MQRLSIIFTCMVVNKSNSQVLFKLYFHFTTSMELQELMAEKGFENIKQLQRKIKDLKNKYQNGDMTYRLDRGFDTTLSYSSALDANCCT